MTTTHEHEHEHETRVAAALTAVAARRASATQAEQVEAAQRAAAFPGLVSRCFIGPGNAKGRQKMFVATKEELSEYEATKPRKAA